MIREDMQARQAQRLAVFGWQLRDADFAAGAESPRHNGIQVIAGNEQFAGAHLERNGRTIQAAKNVMDDLRLGDGYIAAFLEQIFPLYRQRLFR